MNLLIAIMSESFGRLNGNKIPSTLKAFCQLMEEHEFIISYKTDFKDARYILYMGGEETFEEITPVEYKLDQVQKNVKTTLKLTEHHSRKMLRHIEDHNATSFAKQHDTAENMIEMMRKEVEQGKECLKSVSDSVKDVDSSKKKIDTLEEQLGLIMDHLEIEREEI